MERTDAAPLLLLHKTLTEMPQNFKVLVLKKCNWNIKKYDTALLHPENCSLEEQEKILKVGYDLLIDLWNAIAHSHQALKDIKSLDKV